MIPRTHVTRFKAALLAMFIAALLEPCASLAATSLTLGGAIEGRVTDTNGQARMGATVQVYNRQEKLVERALTDDGGFFVFAGLAPDIYSIRVSFATFVPVLRNQIQVQAGQSQLLDISLSGLFSSIRLLPPTSHNDGILNEDWKWVLRSSSANRPVFRFLPSIGEPSTSQSTNRLAGYFTDNRGMVSFSAGDLSSGGPAGEVGTAFAFATNVKGVNDVQFAGNVAYANDSDAPSAAIRTTYRRATDGDSPEISVTLRQLYIPRWSPLFDSAASESGPPPLRSIASDMGNKMELTDSLVLDYGVGLDTIAFIDHVHYFSPYARLTWTLQDGGKLNITYTSGNARHDLGREPSVDTDANNPDAPETDLQRDVAGLAAPAALTLVDDHARVERGEDYEAGYSRRFGSREVLVSIYREDVQNAALMISGEDSSGFSGNLIPDVYTDGVLFNAGNYHTMGFSSGLTQNLGDNYQVTVEYGSVGVLTPRSGLDADTPQDLRGLLATSQRQAVTAIATATIPHAGTHFKASYQFLDDRAALVARLYATQGMEADPGFTISVRQPIPAVLGLPFRMEATAEVRNILAQGYLPVSSSDGRLLLVQTPRSLRGGVNFHF